MVEARLSGGGLGFPKSSKTEALGPHADNKKAQNMIVMFRRIKFSGVKMPETPGTEVQELDIQEGS